ncbi:bile acid:sodium symporter family protein [Pseudalkalibacillus hwajinpoensis]|uniref:bile acid:sodium symporter family protein n=1 Tax=Guptibacillus hwajinpoensis TaxID=208199 RepID=UPI001CD38D37|nr:bile acid:sodium symporter family protein [Pseudalkalibacillus hwajinpoensis]MCA0993001.1 bile acid:sodium symporter family protein [Pseudalkalibacillus hwajinpoensis]
MKALEKASRFAGNTFAIWVLLFAVLGFLYPEGFTWITSYITILLGIIMFGMGMTLSTNDFKEIVKQPKSVAIGVAAQFIIMPLLAYALAVVFRLPAEVAVGVILVGCCPGGTASNVITYLSKGNTALSVAITAVSTLLAPLLTPALVLLFASQWLPVSAGDLFLSIFQMVVIPITLGVIVKLIFKEKVAESVKALPLVSVISIVAIVAAVVGASKDRIAETGLLIFSIVILHNLLGLMIGYFLAKLFRLNERDQRAISIEVGMQNSGLGAALAAAHFNPIAAVPSAIFSVWHNISGPILATIWSKRKPATKEQNVLSKRSA